MPSKTRAKKNIINAHMHVFTGDFVPPYLGKTIVPWPFYYLLQTEWIVRLFRIYFKYKSRRDFGNADTKEEEQRLRQLIYADKRKKRKMFDVLFFITSRWYLNVIYRLVLLWLSLIATLYIIEFLINPFTSADAIIERMKALLSEYSIYFDFAVYFKFAWVVLVFLYIKWSRIFIYSVLKMFFPVVKKLINKQTRHLVERYYLMGRFAFYNHQQKIAQRALHQLPPHSSIVILPMDMEYMGAGKTKMTPKLLESKNKNISDKGWMEEDYNDVYKYQMRELWEFVKKKDKSGPQKKYYPFVFLDPRRIAEEGKDFFDYKIEGNKMVLKPCFVKTFMENRRFNGFKIYPALGYYPFDEHLLPIWRYAAENNIPITAHCVFGTIYYRGKKKQEWNYHPVFKEKVGNDKYMPMLLPELKNVNFQTNFTHPLNYLCLLEERFLKEVIRQTNEGSEVRKLFGYSESDDRLKYNLSDLKICFAHFGGEEEWIRYLEQDRENYSQRLMCDPVGAINFMKNNKGEFSWYKINDLWNKVDWYSLICSMLIRYDNVYADLSYIISKQAIYPLLKNTLEKGENYDKEHEAYLAESEMNKKATHYTGKNKLRSRVLFGTDFYVVRNHKSDKDLFIEAKARLGDEGFDLIARENPHNFLSRI